MGRFVSDVKIYKEAPQYFTSKITLSSNFSNQKDNYYTFSIPLFKFTHSANKNPTYSGD
jgi:hypothetical protein